MAGRLKKFVDRMEVVDSSFVEEIVKENNSRKGQDENGAEEARREDGAEKSDEETSEKVSDEGAEM